jgi:hypothetical protein
MGVDGCRQPLKAQRCESVGKLCDIVHRIIECAAERNPDKYGAVTLGTDIPIVSEAESRAMRPDYYLVLPWHFRDEFLQRERKTLASGIKFIFPLPSIEIVSENMNGELIASILGDMKSSQIIKEELLVPRAVLA